MVLLLYFTPPIFTGGEQMERLDFKRENQLEDNPLVKIFINRNLVVT